MDTLTITLFGCPRLTRVTNTTNLSPLQISTTNLSLFAYLLLHRNHFCSREVLIDQFWREHPEKNARKCLNTALWRLRSTLKMVDIQRNSYILSTHTGEVGFNWDSNYWLDVETFEQQIALQLCQPFTKISAKNIQTIKETIQLYQGDFLEGFYEHWALQERERLRRIYLNSLTYLMRYYAHHTDFDTSIQYGQQILELEPLYEKIHREIIALYMQNGQRTLAIQQYETCRRWLAQELDMRPMEETKMLYQQLVTQNQAKRPQSIQIPQVALRQEILNELQQATQQLHEAQAKLTRVTQLVENVMGITTV